MAIPDATLDEVDAFVAQGFARALYVHAFQMWAIEVEPRPDLPAGRPWNEVAPDTVMTRAAGIQAAREFEEGIAKENADLGPHPFAAMYEQCISLAEPDTRIRGVRTDRAARSFGALLAGVCLGVEEASGCLSEVALPNIHVELDDDGQEMSWEDRGWNHPESTVNPAPAGNPAGRWANSDVQSLLFDKARYTERQAQRWAQDHGFKYGSVDAGHGDYIHLRQFQHRPGQPCATVDFGHGIEAVVCATRNPVKGALEILIVEQDPDEQTATIRLLKKAFGTSPRFITADNVGAAIADMEVHEFILVVSEVELLGERTGIDLFRQVQQQYPHMVDRFVFLTQDDRALGTGARHIEKGTSPEDFKRMIKPPGAERRPPTPTRSVVAEMTLPQFAQVIVEKLPFIKEEMGNEGLPRGRFDDKVFVAAAWRQLRSDDPRFRSMTLEQFKRRLLDANREELLRLSRADSQGDMDDREVRESEISDRGATFHFISEMRRQRTAAAPARTATANDVAQAVNEVMPRIQTEMGPTGLPRGRFGAQKVFVAALWRRLRDDPRFRGMTLEKFKQLLLEASRNRMLILARADLVSAMDFKEVSESEISDHGATFHFVMDQQANEPWVR
jgi:hypothetical protein